MTKHDRQTLKVTALLVCSLAFFAYGCGDTYDCRGIICDACEPDQVCCSGSCQAVYEEQGEESVLVGHYCLDTPPQTCPLEPI